MKTRNIFFLLLTVACFCAACQEPLEQRCLREAKDYTAKNCPALIAKDVTIDSLTFNTSTHTLTYSYTLGGVLDDAAIVSKSELRQQMLASLRDATSLKIYKDAGYSFRYVYYSKKQRGAKLMDITFRSKDYMPSPHKQN